MPGEGGGVLTILMAMINMRQCFNTRLLAGTLSQTETEPRNTKAASQTIIQGNNQSSRDERRESKKFSKEWNLKINNLLPLLNLVPVQYSLSRNPLLVEQFKLS